VLDINQRTLKYFPNPEVWFLLLLLLLLSFL